MKRIATLLLGAVAILATEAPAHAVPLTASTILQDFNAVIFGSASTSADIEGAAIMGGGFVGATVYNNPTAAQPAGFGALTVFGSTGGNPLNINNGGNAYVGGTRGATINFNGGGRYIAAPAYTIVDLQKPLYDLSQTLSHLTATGTLPTPTNNEVIKAIPGAKGIAVFNLTVAQLAAIPSFSVNLNGASTVVFNVQGSAAQFNAGDQSGTNGANNIIWNFYDATGTVAINALIGGTVLAPGATVTNNNQIDGVLVAKGWTGSGEVHDWQFTGNLPTAAPEPASLGLFAAGLVTLGVLRRRQRTRAPTPT